MADGTDLALRTTMTQIEQFRTRTLELYGEAFDKLAEAASYAPQAAPASRLDVRLTMFSHVSQRDASYAPRQRDRDDFINILTQRLDASIWEHLLTHMGLEALMDKTARDEFRETLRKEPPPATYENCFATMSGLVQDSGLIFRRGLSKAFSGLDRRFRSHDGFKIGARVVLNHALSDHGGWNYHWRRDETFRDIERVFKILDGQKHSERYASVIDLVRDQSRGGTLGVMPGLVEDDYFRVRWFKNGNMHVWFKRDDLVEQVNKLLAEYYGATLGEGSDVAEPDVAGNRGIVAKGLGFFETPEALAAELADDAQIEPAHRVLEPSAGLGRIARACRAKGARVDCIEIDPGRAAQLRDARYQTDCRDFLDVPAKPIFDRIVMNPPFDRGLDVDHVNHAIGFLKPGGVLIAVMSASTEFRDDERTTRFRDRVKAMGGVFRDLPPGSFSESGTNVNTIKLAIGRGRYW